jgi:outer membrane immunogenic protein
MSILRNGMIGLAVVAGAGLAAVPALADGSRRPTYDQPYYSVVWQGLYGGLNVGFGDADGADGGIVGGGQIGYNWQNGRIVYGVEADISFTDIGTSIDLGWASADASLDWIATLRGRLGYLIDPRLMVYGTAGIGWAHASWDVRVLSLHESGSETNSGFVIGLGGEYKINETMTTRIEYLTGAEDIGDFGIIRAGLNFKLNQ